MFEIAEFDLSSYKGLFLEEAEEELQILDEGFLLLEREGDNPELLNRVFRAVHTLKGSAATMGYERLATLAHEVESILDAIRQGKERVSRELVDLLLNCLDALRSLKEEAREGQEKTEIEPLVFKLRTFGFPALPRSSEEKVEPVVFNATEEMVIQEVQAQGYHVWQVRVILSEDCLMKGVRAFLVFKNLEESGEIIKAIPPVEEIEAEKFGDTFELFLVTKEDAQGIQDRLNKVSEIAAVEVLPVTLPFPSEKAKAAPFLPEGVSSPEEELFPKASIDDQSFFAKKTSQTVRVDVQRLDNFLNLVGELVIDRGRLATIGDELRRRLGTEALVDGLEEVTVHIGRITGELQEEIMKARMFPIDRLFNRFPRMVRDLAAKAGKEVKLLMEGRETELDRLIIEEISDPLIHLLRNGIDHGIEPPEQRKSLGKPLPGSIRLKASHEENQIVITVEDDGQGMDPELLRRAAVERKFLSPEAAARLSEKEALNLIFLPGFSTSSKVSDVSGRGVGMDIVRSHLERINGKIEIETKKGEGSRFIIRLPLTLAINRSLLVEVGAQVLAFPLTSVVEVLNISSEEIQRVQNQEVISLRGRVLPLLPLARVLGMPSAGEKGEVIPVVVVRTSEQDLGFTVDNLIGEQEIVIKSLGEYLGQIPGITGATILGNGQVALILDILGLVAGAKQAYNHFREGSQKLAS